MFMFFFSSGIRYTNCALVTGVQTCALPIYQPVRVVDAHRALHEGPVREKAPDVSEFEDERSGEFARLHGRGVAVLGPVSFKIALVAIDLVEMIKKMIERSEERRVGKECVSTCRYRWSPYL